MSTENDPEPFTASGGSGAWIKRMDRRLWGIVTPFVMGVTVGIALTTLLFVIAFLTTG